MKENNESGFIEVHVCRQLDIKDEHVYPMMINKSHVVSFAPRYDDKFFAVQAWSTITTTSGSYAVKEDYLELKNLML